MNKIWIEIKRHWQPLLISLLLFAFAAALNAVMDTLVHHYSISIFSTLQDQQWWNPAVSWENKYNYSFPFSIVQLSDAWHFFKTIMIAVIAYTFIFTSRRIPVTWGRVLVYTILYGLAWNLSFNVFYNHLLLE